MMGTILIVEVYDPLRKSLRDWLALDFAQCNTIEAGSVSEAMEMVRDSLPQVIIIDIDMPQMNGLEAARRVKAAAPGVQIVILALDESQAHRAQAAKAGASAYVPKSTLETELIPTLEALLARWG